VTHKKEIAKRRQEKSLDETKTDPGQVHRRQANARGQKTQFRADDLRRAGQYWFLRNGSRPRTLKEGKSPQEEKG